MPDLLATCWTTAGAAAPYPGQLRSPRNLRGRIEAAAAAGFAGFGLLDADLQAHLERHSYADLRRMLDDVGMRYIELEFLTNWWTTDDRRAPSDALRRLLFEAAAELGARDVKVAPDVSGVDPDFGRFADEFAVVCEQAADAGTIAVLEFMPFANIRDIHAGVALLEAAGRPRSGALMVDTWHLERAGTDPQELLGIGAWAVGAVELDDGDALPVGDPYDDTCLRRRLCGQGDFRIVEWIRALAQMGWRGPWGIEILSEEFRVRDLQESVDEAFATSALQFAKAGVD